MYYFKSVDTGSICSAELDHDAKAFRDMKGYYVEVSEEEFDLYQVDRAKLLKEVAAKEAKTEATKAKALDAAVKAKKDAAAEADQAFLQSDFVTRQAIAHFDARQSVMDRDLESVTAALPKPAKKAPKSK